MATSRVGRFKGAIFLSGAMVEWARSNSHRSIIESVEEMKKEYTDLHPPQKGYFTYSRESLEKITKRLQSQLDRAQQALKTKD